MRGIYLAPIVVVFLTYVTATAQQDISRSSVPRYMANTVEVDSDGQLDAQPDTMRIDYQLFAQDKQLRNAYARVQKQAAELRQTLQNSGIRADQLHIGRYEVDPTYTAKHDKPESFAVYEQLTAELTDFSKLAPLVDVAADPNAPVVQGISFVLKDMEQAKDKAVADGFDKAQRRAEQAARAVGMKAKLAYASVDVPEPPILQRAETYAAADSTAVFRKRAPAAPAATAAFSAQMITVRAHIHAVFQLTP